MVDVVDFEDITPGSLLAAWADPANERLAALRDALNDMITALGGAATDETTAMAAALGIAGVTELVVASAVDKKGLYVHGAADTVTKNLVLVDDSGFAPIFAIANAGGLYLNDLFKQHRFVLSEPGIWSNIYGNRVMGGMGEFAFAGPPGNFLSYKNACQETFEGSRAGDKGDWQVAFGSAGDVTVVSESGNPAGSSHVIQVASHTTSMRVETLTGVSAYPVVAGDTYSSLAYIKAVATARSPQIGFQWWDSGAGFISETFGSGVATNTSTYTKVTSGALTAPVGAAYGAPCIYWPTSVNGELHKISAAAMYHSSQTVWAPPFVCQPYPTWGSARAGDKWWRLDTPSTSNQRLYICTTGGLPHQQVWSGIL